MVVEQHRPAILGHLLPLRFIDSRSEASHHHIRPLRLQALDGDILLFPDWDERSSTGDEVSRGPRSCNGLEVDLLKVDDVLVVERDVFGVEFVADGLVEGVRWFGHFVTFLSIAWRCIKMFSL